MSRLFVVVLITSSLLVRFSICGQELTQKEGYASYYADRFQGRTTASGETFDMNQLTGAHPTLPFNTLVRITHVKTQRQVVVRINDRGPYSHKRILDMSKAAARELGILGKGAVLVRLEVMGMAATEDLPPPTTATPVATTEAANAEDYEAGRTYSQWGTPRPVAGFGLQVSSYHDLESARADVKALAALNAGHLFIQVDQVDATKVYRVLVGAYPTSEEAAAQLPQLLQLGYEGFVKKHMPTPAALYPSSPAAHEN
ncbi:rare lipoprotein A [Catalinimonas alkaloidigena]|uniref:Probable endolytic peptidoglycan transglycosylase RlpA n=1 Tax=Catalinimonas alkaloidigena TaxID=1075417 RepID=A0A1G8WCX2_9BACT|nr:septal ring lytic transglycosylase RlpA family protein [Catalinimonas alkaloidigena]SDJ76128.1 rare lipoprotein A [Catalinimonas alkaloidigena]